MKLVNYFVNLQPAPRPPEFQHLDGENEILGKHFPGRVVLWPQWIWKSAQHRFAQFVSLFIRTLLGERFCLAAAMEVARDHHWCKYLGDHVCPPENIAKMGMSLRPVPLARPSYPVNQYWIDMKGKREGMSS